jgi:hypothetical protein
MPTHLRQRIVAWVGFNFPGFQTAHGIKLPDQFRVPLKGFGSGQVFRPVLGPKRACAELFMELVFRNVCSPDSTETPAPVNTVILLITRKELIKAEGNCMAENSSIIYARLSNHLIICHGFFNSY